MRNDFAIFILTHGRADRVRTADLLKRCGYDGRWYVVIDDEDTQEDEYRKRYGDRVLQFCKADIASRYDEGNNFGDRRSILFARNAAYELAREIGVRWFMQLDDDYTSFLYRFGSNGDWMKGASIRKTMNQALESMVGIMECSDMKCLCMSQGGDWIGGEAQMRKHNPMFRRKAMNSFLCCVDRQVRFCGLMNEDVNTILTCSRRGFLFMTLMQIMLTQVQTQTNDGGITELYKRFGTYVKTFYSVMYAPSCVKVSTLVDPAAAEIRPRFHHLIDWNATAPKIVRESLRKQSA